MQWIGPAGRTTADDLTAAPDQLTRLPPTRSQGRSATGQPLLWGRHIFSGTDSLAGGVEGAGAPHRRQTRACRCGHAYRVLTRRNLRHQLSLTYTNHINNLAAF